MNPIVDPGLAGRSPVQLAVQNVVAAARIADALPLAVLVAKIPGAVLPKRSYPGIVLRLSSPQAVCHIYRSGKIVLKGFGSADRLPGAFASVVEVLRAAGIALLEPVPEPRIINLVASGKFGERISLLRFAMALDLERVEYDPEQFAGLVYRADAGGVALIFASGAIVVMGMRSLDQAHVVLSEVEGVIDSVGAWQSCD